MKKLERTASEAHSKTHTVSEATKGTQEIAYRRVHTGEGAHEANASYIRHTELDTTLNDMSELTATATLSHDAMLSDGWVHSRITVVLNTRSNETGTICDSSTLHLPYPCIHHRPREMPSVCIANSIGFIRYNLCSVFIVVQETFRGFKMTF